MQMAATPYEKHFRAALDFYNEKEDVHWERMLREAWDSEDAFNKLAEKRMGCNALRRMFADDFHRQTSFENNSYSAMDTLTRLNKYPSDLINVEVYFKYYWMRAQHLQREMCVYVREAYLGISCQCLVIVHYMHTNSKSIKEPRKKIDSLCS